MGLNQEPTPLQREERTSASTIEFRWLTRLKPMTDEDWRKLRTLFLDPDPTNPVETVLQFRTMTKDAWTDWQTVQEVSELPQQ